MSQEWDEIQYDWHHSNPVEGVAFLKDDRVNLTESNPGDSGTVVSLAAIDPEPIYEVATDRGERVVRSQSRLASPVPPDTLSNIAWIQRWYASQCDGDWEHSWGLNIQTLDNPGWAIKINLVETSLESVPFSPIEYERSARDWVHCRVVDKQWQGAGGPHKLADVLDQFVRWARQNETPAKNR